MKTNELIDRLPRGWKVEIGEREYPLVLSFNLSGHVDAEDTFEFYWELITYGHGCIEKILRIAPTSNDSKDGLEFIENSTKDELIERITEMAKLATQREEEREYYY